MDLREQLSELNRIGAALSSERNLSVLLGMILTEARRFTNAEGGTLYTCEKGMLRFELAQNEMVSGQTESAGAPPSLRGQLLPASKESLSGYCAVTGESLNIPNAYAIPDGVAYRFNNQFDKQSGYRTQSLLVLPLKLANGEVIGVLQLINARDEKRNVIPFESQCEDLVRSLASQAAVAYRNAKLTQALKDAYMDTIVRLCNATEFRDQDTAEHINRMSRYSAAIAAAYGMSDEEVEAILYASPMHDIGKVGIPDAILLKPGKLTPEEFEIMKRHTLFGAAILEGAEAPVLQFSREIALTHHEKFNGTGYPNGLKGTEIPIAGRIVAIADVFDALTSERCYKPAFAVDKAVLVIADGSGTHFDPDCVTAFLKALDRILQIKRDFAVNKAKLRNIVNSAQKLFERLACCLAAFVMIASASGQSVATPVVEALPAFSSGARILFQGDSITDGNRGRSADPNHILGHGYAFIIAAKYGAAFPERNLTFLNRGISGNKVTDLATRWQKDTLDLKPDLLSILIGVNDASAGMPLDQFEAVYDQLLTDTRAANPGIRLVLCEPFTLPSNKNKEHWDQWLANIQGRQIIVAKLAKKHGAALVQFQKVFDEASKLAKPDYWIWDGIHPTYSGHQLMADEWVRAVKGFWPGK